MNDNTATAKKVLQVVVKLGTGRIVHSIIRNNVETDEDRTLDKVTVPAASYVLGGMAAEATEQYTDRLVDDTVATYHKLRAAFKKD